MEIKEKVKQFRCCESWIWAIEIKSIFNQANEDIKEFHSKNGATLISLSVHQNTLATRLAHSLYSSTENNVNELLRGTHKSEY